MDVIREVDQRPILSKDIWTVRVARHTAGEAVRAKIQRGEELSDIEITAVEIAAARLDRHGLTLRTRRGRGAEIVSVEAGSPAAEAGLEAGDLLTHVGTISTPSAAQTARVLAETAAGASVVIALERGGSHRVIALQRSW
jgi:S1-C subfamily serine protease